MFKSLLKRRNKRRKKTPGKLSIDYDPITFNAHSDIYFRLMDSTADTNEATVQNMLYSDGSISFGLEKDTDIFRRLSSTFEGREVFGLEDPQWSLASFQGIVGFAQGRTEMLQRLLFLQASPICFEEGFVRSVLPEIYAQRNPDLRHYANNISYRLDSVGPHFLPRSNVGIRRFLKEHEFTEEQRVKGRDLRLLLIEKNISKYNFVQGDRPVGDDYVLVIDQAYNDLSVYLQGGEEGIFRHMLEAAIEENPGSKIAVKLHPEFKHRKTYLFPVPDEYKDKMVLFADDTDIMMLLAASHSVYTFSSTVGLEAIIREKRAVVFGNPVYAGYGLSDDRCINLPTNRRLTADELVYALYLQNMLYLSPSTGERCHHLQAIDELLWLKKKFVAEVL